jgi:hypothetical protein
MDLDLLHRALAERGEPRFRERQVWEWTARGAAGYGEMTNVPANLREALVAAPRSRPSAGYPASNGSPSRRCHCALRYRCTRPKKRFAPS